MLPSSRKIAIDFTHYTCNKQPTQSGDRQVAQHNNYPQQLPLSTSGKFQMARAYPIACYFTLSGIMFPPFIVFYCAAAESSFLVRIPGLNSTSDVNKAGCIFVTKKTGTMQERFTCLFDDVMIPELMKFNEADKINSSGSTYCVLMDGQWEQLKAAERHHDGFEDDDGTGGGGIYGDSSERDENAFGDLNDVDGEGGCASTAAKASASGSKPVSFVVSTKVNNISCMKK